MKIFWSWQSDTPGKTGRFLVRTAIDDAVQALKQDPDVSEPFEREDEAFDELHVDQDRQGVPGSPDLAPLIFEKIANAAVFVADVTPVGDGMFAKDGEELKKLTNANVAIELGYAFGKLGGGKVLMVMNEHYGKRGHLPFDLRGKGGPLLYKLAPDATKEEIESERKRLKKQFKDAIGLCIGGQQEAVRRATPFPAKEAPENASQFRRGDEPVGQFFNELPKGFGLEGPVYAHFGPSLWLRVMPRNSIGRTFSAPELRKAGLYGKHGTLLTPLEFYGNNLHNLVAEDGIGLASVSIDSQGVGMPHTDSVAWLFETGEIWSWLLLQRGQTIAFLENKLADHLKQYADVLVALDIDGPYRWIAGLTEVKGFDLEIPPIEGRAPRVGRAPTCLANSIIKEGIFDDGDSPHASLMPFFEEVFRKCSTERSKYFG